MGLPSTAPRPDLNQPGFEELAREVEDLKRRVRELEARASAEIATPVSQPTPALPIPEIRAPAGAVVLFGKALLALAGAYLLRALTDAALVPRGLGLAAGLAYAGAWLWIASRSLPNRKFAAALEVCTSAAIVGPLLWEATLLLHAISSWAAAAIITAFAIAGLVLSWRKRSTVVARIAFSAAAVITTALLIGSHDLLPFTLAMLALAAVVEFAALRDYRITERWLVAALADLAVILFAYIATRKAGTAEGYATVTWPAAFALQGALVAIYGGNAFTRRATVGEIVQLAAAMISAFVGAMMIGTANPVTGALALGFGICCYAASLRSGRDRTSTAYSTLGFMLVIGGAWLSLSGLALVGACAIFAIASCRQRLYLHSAAYLLVVAGLSGLALETAKELLGSSAPGYGIAYGVVISAALVCYLLIGTESKTAAVLVASTLAWLLAGAATRTAVGLLPGVAPASRTFVLMALSLVLASAGVRSKKAELTWLVYAFMTLGAYKILTQDFPQERRMMLVVSLLLYGSTLMVLPRLLRSNAPGTASAIPGGRGSI
jgi:hypothetical protein